MRMCYDNGNAYSGKRCKTGGKAMVYIADNKLIREYDGERMLIEAFGENSLRVRVTRLRDFLEENWALIPQPE